MLLPPALCCLSLPPTPAFRFFLVVAFCVFFFFAEVCAAW